MKYYIEFPINLYCGLQCPYCFHTEAYQLEKEGRRYEKYREQRLFTLEQYINWRNKFLSDGTDFLCELHGGEISHPKNQEDVLNIINTFDKEKFQIQTNGLGDLEFYQKLCHHKDKINRLGFTFHRTVIQDKPELVKRFKDNVLYCNSHGIKVYVKELLITQYRDQILKHKREWKERNIEFRIQDFKGYGRGKTHEEYKNYTEIDRLLIHNEYKHVGTECCCRVGYKNVLIRGFDIFDGDVVACWDDPCVIGNILKDWYNPNYKISKDFEKGHIDVKGVEKIYRGTFPRDVWTPDAENTYKSLTIQDIEKNQ